ncbi:hypothetical protein, conserved [Plasmodium gonderi]|uniref:Uncharacterized protein n=1 Tax=Plasmodium gonderi TaxID=77519 RepID=A0A1Y1JNW3_PLAGO|nr:hypothetical protein, conserved [Plasmodium gonderi]GAW83218.1 hypothetical protein, conserved [Plasmodium gonderi]
MSNYNNYMNKQCKDKSVSATRTLSSTNNCQKKEKQPSLCSLTKVFALTIVILVLQCFNKNGCYVNGISAVNKLESSHGRSLSEMNPNYTGQGENMNYSDENVNEMRNYNNNVNGAWVNNEHAGPSMCSGPYCNANPQSYGQNMNEVNLNVFHTGLGEHLKKNIIYILPGMIAAYYAWNSLGTQPFLLIAAIIGVFLFANQHGH